MNTRASFRMRGIILVRPPLCRSPAYGALPPLPQYSFSCKLTYTHTAAETNHSNSVWHVRSSHWFQRRRGRSICTRWRIRVSLPLLPSTLARVPAGYQDWFHCTGSHPSWWSLQPWPSERLVGLQKKRHTPSQEVDCFFSVMVSVIAQYRMFTIKIMISKRTSGTFMVRFFNPDISRDTESHCSIKQICFSCWLLHHMFLMSGQNGEVTLAVLLKLCVACLNHDACNNLMEVYNPLDWRPWPTRSEHTGYAAEGESINLIHLLLLFFPSATAESHSICCSWWAMETPRFRSERNKGQRTRTCGVGRSSTASLPSCFYCTVTSSMLVGHFSWFWQLF